MASRIKCPHCGAGNRDTQESTQCWQCAKPLWEAAERGTYRLDSMPPLGGTTTLRPDRLPTPLRDIKPVARWKLWAAAIAAVLTFVAFCAVLIIYLEAIWRH